MQVRERLFEPYFHQWLRDTEELLENLPQGLEAPEQSPALPLTFERWLLQLKVCSARAHNTHYPSVKPHGLWSITAVFIKQTDNLMTASPGAISCLMLMCQCLILMQGLQRLLLFGFPSDAQSLESIPAVGQASCAPSLRLD